MPTYNELYRQTQNIIKDRALDKDIPNELNRAVQTIADWSSPLILLPALKRTSTVTTSTDLPYVSLPAVFLRQLYHVESANKANAKINIIQSDHTMRKIWGDMDTEGDVEDVCADKETGRLYYQGIPSTSDTLTLYFYEKPDDLDGTVSDEITVVPSQYQMSTICRMAAAKILMNIDVNRAVEQTTLYINGLNQLHEYLQDGYHRVETKRTAPGYI